MDKQVGRNNARQAVHAVLAQREINPTDFSRDARIDIATVSDFLEGARWPKITTQGRMEKALGWPAGSIQAIATGSEPPSDSSVSADTEDERVIKMRRPEGMSVEDWKRKADELEEEIEWKLNRAARER